MKPFKEGKAEVGNSSGHGIIDKNGIYLAPPIYEEIIHRNWVIILHKNRKYKRNHGYYDFSTGLTTFMTYHSNPSFKSLDNCIYDVSDAHEDRAFAKYENYMGIITVEGKTIEPIEYEWVPLWYSPRFNEGDEIYPVRRNGVWEKLNLKRGFVPATQTSQENAEDLYRSTIRRERRLIPYFYKNETNVENCGFLKNNLYYLSLENYLLLCDLENDLSEAEKKEWLVDHNENNTIRI